MINHNNAFAELAARGKKLEELRREIQIGIDELDRGEFAPLDVEEIKRKGRELLKQQLKGDRLN